MIDEEEIRYRLLIVDDEEFIRLAHQRILSTEFDVEIAKDGEEAIAKCQNDYHAIIMDVNLPGLNGIEVTKQIRQLLKTKPYMPIIGVTAHVEEDVLQDCIDAGMNEVLVKPVLMKILKYTIRKWCNVN